MPGRYYFDKKSRVDDYRQFSIGFLKKHRYLDRGVSYNTGGMSWTRHGETIGSIGFSVEKSDEDGIGKVQVQFTQKGKATDEKKDFDYAIPIRATPCHYGGLRWWFLDPCSQATIRCGILYLQSNGYFTSRKSLNLTYDSRSEPKRGFLINEMRIMKAEALYEKIKYPYRNGLPTKKMRRVLRYVENTSYSRYYDGDIANIFGYR